MKAGCEPLLNALIFLAARRKICLSSFPSLSFILADQWGQVLTTACLPPAPLLPDSWVASAAGTVGLSEKNCTQTSGLHCSSTGITISFKSFLKYINPNEVHSRRAAPGHSVLNSESPKLNWEVFKWPKLTYPCFEWRGGFDDLCRVPSSLNFPMRVQSFLYGSVQVAPPSFHRYCAGLWWQTTVEYFGADLKIAFGHGNSCSASKLWDMLYFFKDKTLPQMFVTKTASDLKLKP